jgi:alpha-1,2-mannosyltransferase
VASFKREVIGVLKNMKTFLFFISLNMIAIFLNHIDDTDETYGYWEPLHYLLFGHGMQTWEYSPDFAIRTYAFIYPLLMLGSIAKPYFPNKVQLFLLMRVIFGFSTAFSESMFLNAIKIKFQNIEFMVAFIFTAFSSGMFFTSTSFLPSAVTMNFVMLSYSQWINNNYLASVAFGCFAVLWSGWPFVSILFLPIGVHMLWHQYELGYSRKKVKFDGLIEILKIIFYGIFILFLIALPAVLLDIKMYNKL